MNKSRQTIQELISLFLGWRLALLFVTYIGLSTFANTDPVKHLLFFPSNNLDYWIRWANWDGGHYRHIAQHGYMPFQTVFFPAYPLLIKLFMFLKFPVFWAGFLVSHLATILSMFLLYKLSRLDLSEKMSKNAVFILLIFPTSFYLVSLYSESLFLAVSLAAFYFARKQSWVLAALFAGLAATTRLVGVAVIAAIFAEYLFKESRPLTLSSFWQTPIRRLLIYSLVMIFFINLTQGIIFSTQHWVLGGVLSTLKEILFYPLIFFILLAITEYIVKSLSFKKFLSRNFFYLCLSFLPILLYILFQSIQFNSPLGFLTNESNWGRTASFPWSAPLHYFNLLKWRHFFEVGESARSLNEFLFFLFGLTCLFISFLKLRISYSIYFLLAFTLPLLSGTLVALPRYLLTIFPLFLLLAQIKNETIQKSGLFLSLLLLALLSMLYINSYWVT